MHAALADLLGLLDLERIETNLFRGRNEQQAGPRVFGGQVMAQALRAASHTVADPEQSRLPHSLHGYFLRPGDSRRQILFDVEHSRDGGSFTTRRVRAIQKGESIFSMSVSFQIEEAGLEHQTAIGDWPAPEALEDDVLTAQRLGEENPNVMPWTLRERPFEVRSVYPVGTPQPDTAVKPAWYRARSPLPDDPVLHCCLLAYVSDMGLMSTSLVPHAQRAPRSAISGASLDHAMWFHRQLRVDDWFLYDRDSPIASGSRGFNRGSFHDRSGMLAASAAQESLIRVRSDR